jgi:predicted esterase
VSWGHADERLVTLGPSPGEARAVVVLVHGRGASAESILELSRHLPVGDPGGDAVAYLAPQAARHTWYPQSFMAPREANQPALGEALARLEAVVGDLLERGVERQRIVVAGFSQGACLASEFVARSAADRSGAWGGLAAFTGGLIGDELPEYGGDLAGTPVFLAAGDPDPHVPWRRMDESAAVFEGLGAAVDLRRYPGMPHTVNQEELDWLAGRLGKIVGG